MNNFIKPVLVLLAGLSLAACSGGGGSKTDTPTTSSSSSSSSSSNSSSSSSTSSSTSGGAAGIIRLNQVGYLPNGQKYAVVPGSGATTFALIDDSNNEVFSASLESAATWAPANESAQLADFASFTMPGNYRLRVSGFADTAPFEIGGDVYLDAHDKAIKAYYFNRASTALEETYAGDWARTAGHPDDQVRIHSSAADSLRPVNSEISAPKGWYDAGDYNKYIVNSGISTYTLLAAYEHFESFYSSRTWNIPESGNAMPDLLDEILWNLDWMQAMQDPNDGGVYHKLTTLSFSGDVMPSVANAQRYVVAKGTAATLNFAAVMAVASRVYEPFDASRAAEFEAAAESAWSWAKNNSNIVFTNPTGVVTGEYGDNSFSDEFAWAAAELFITTGDANYYTEFENYNAGAGVPGWQYVAPLGHMSLAFHSSSTLATSDYQASVDALVSTANTLETRYSNSAYKVSMVNSDFVWGSNSMAMNQAMILLQAYRLTDDNKYRQAALGAVDYVLGKNPTDYSYVTGVGSNPPMNIHHRQSEADSVVAPVPGFLAGGPNPGQQDGCNYTSDEPAKSYVDDWCSYASNEVTINWNAPLVYVLAALSTP